MSLAHIITPAWLRTNYMAGIPTKTKTGVVFDDRVFSPVIYSAVDSLEKRLDLTLTGHAEALHEERLDTMKFHGELWHLNNLGKRPIAKVRKFQAQYGNYPPSELSLSWFMLRDHVQGRMQVTLGPGAFQLPSMQTPAGLHMGLGTGRPIDYGFLRFDYVSGFVLNLPATATAVEGSTTVTLTPTTPAEGEVARDVVTWLKPGHHVRLGTDRRILQVAFVDPTSIELVDPSPFSVTNATLQGYTYDASLIETAAMIAAIPLLDVIGNFILGAPATAGKHLGVDALTQGKVYAVAPGKGPFAAMQNTYREALAANLEALLRRYERIQVFSF